MEKTSKKNINQMQHVHSLILIGKDLGKICISHLRKFEQYLDIDYIKKLIIF